MSYSAFFTAGLTLASQPRDYEYSFSKLPPLQINVHPGTPRRTRKRRSSLTIATSPIITIKSPIRAARSALCSASPRDGTFLEALHNGTRPRRKTVSNVKDLPSLPAPTTPLPTIPGHHINVAQEIHVSSTPITSVEDAYPSSPISCDTTRPAYHPGTLRSNPARKSSFLLPMFGRGALLPGAHAGTVIPKNSSPELEKGGYMEFKMAPPAVWSDDEVDMKDNDGDV